MQKDIFGGFRYRGRGWDGALLVNRLAGLNRFPWLEMEK